ARERPHRTGIAAPVPVYGLAHEAQPHRVELVQHCRCAFGIPPVSSERAEMGGLVRADGGCRSAGGGCILHCASLTARAAIFQQTGSSTALARIVMKFGGTSMAGTERIRRVAGIVKRQQEAGHEVAVVVSAMAGETDRLVGFCREANPLYDPAEYDVVVASGEQVTSGLLALTLQAMGCKARSWLGWQMPVHTKEAHAKARITSID